MNPSQPFQPWVAPLGWLALEAALVVLAALAVQPLLRTAAARRSLWRAALLALIAVLALELTGTGSQLPAQLRLAWQTTFPAPVPPPDPPPALEELPFTPPPIFSLAPTGGEARREGAFPAPEPLPISPEPSVTPPPPSLTLSVPPSPPSPFPAFLWLTGLAALLARAAWTHAGFAWLRLRHFIPAAEALRERVQSLAARLGLRRRVRVLASERLRAPAAFGWVRPGVGVPGDFTARFAPAQQDVMLAHELAHLAARDPLWQLLADLAVAALWWHPLAWVARHQHRLAAELAADDASQALPDGPVVLAECLLVLGHEAAAAPRAPLGMAGFRSQLGRRVERLVALPRRDWSAPGPLRLALQTTTALLALAALALLPGCAANRTASEPPALLVAKWWQAKSKTPETQPRGATLLIQPQPKPVTVEGRVRFNGTPPPEREISLPPHVLAARTNAPLKTRFHCISPDGGLADVLVYVKAGLPNQTFPAPTNTHSIRIQGYEYQPYISAVQTGQPIRWETDVNLNFHPTPTNPANREFNRTLMPGRPVEATFTAPEFFLRTKDDVHPWLFGYVSILPHPFFAVTDAEGRFRFPQPLPPGKYTLAAVHRRAGEVVQELNLTEPLPAGARVTDVVFQFNAPPGSATPPPLISTPQLPAPPLAADFKPSQPPTREELLERKARVVADIKATEKVVGPAHPKMVGLRKQLESLEEALRQLPPLQPALPNAGMDDQTRRKYEATLAELEQRQLQQVEQLRREGKSPKNPGPGYIAYDHIIEELRKRLSTLPGGTNAIDISVGRQLFVDHFLIESNTLKRTWHEPSVVGSPQLTVKSTGPLRGEFPFPEAAWYDAAGQEFRLRFAFRTNSVLYHSPSSTNWSTTNGASFRGYSITDAATSTQRPERASTDYESHRITLHRVFPLDDDPLSSGLYVSAERRGNAFSEPSARTFIPVPRPGDGSRWSDLHPLTNGFLVVGRDLRFYFGGRVQREGDTHPMPAVGLATLRRDGFASLDAGPEGGVLTTKAVTFTGRFLFVNLKTNAPDGELRIEILHPDGRPIVLTKNDTKEQFQPFSRENCIPLAADQTLMGVSWQNGMQDLSMIANRPVRFRFHLKNASLYSFWVGPGQLGRSMGRVAGGGPHFTNEVDTIGNRSYRPFPEVRTNAPAPVAADVRRLTSPRIPTASQSLVTSAATNAPATTRDELLQRQARVEADIKAMEVVIGPTHPKMVGLRKQLESVEEALKQTPPVKHGADALAPSASVAANAPPSAARQELDSIRLRLASIRQVEEKLKNPHLTVLERLSLYASVSEPLMRFSGSAQPPVGGVISIAPRPGRTSEAEWLEWEEQKLRLERTIREHSVIFKPSHPKMVTLHKQYAALEKAQKAELENAAARLETIKRSLSWEERGLTEEVESVAPPPSAAPEKVPKAEGRLRGAATNAIAANPSPQPSPLAAQRESEPESAGPVRDDVRSLTPTQTRIIPGSEAPTTVLAAGNSVRIQIYHLQNGTNQSLAYIGEIAPAGYVPIPRASKAVFIAGKTVEEAARMIHEQLVRDGLESPRVTLDKVAPMPVAPPGTFFRRPTDTYRIHAGDELIVSVWGRDDLRTKGKVQADGRMTLPIVEAVPVAGGTLSDARAAIKAAYQAAHLAEAHVAVQLIRSVQPPKNGMAALSYPTLPDLVVMHPSTLERLAKVRLPEVSFNAESLPAVLQQLTADTQRLHPDLDGIKFEVQKGLFTAAAFDPPPSKYTNASGAVVSVKMKGSPSRSPVRLNFDMDTVSVSLPSALRGVPVLDALEAIVTGADYPIRYTIETNRVIFWQRHSNEASPTPKPPAPKPGASVPAPSPFAERGEKVAEGRLRGAATNAVAANPSPQPSPLSAKREREQTLPIGDDVRSLTPTRSAATRTRNEEVSQSLITSSPTNAAPLHHQPTVEKLARIRLPEVTYDGLPLSEVLKFLQAGAKKFDPDKAGVDFEMQSTYTNTAFGGYETAPPDFAGEVKAQSVGSGTVGVRLTASVPLPRTRIRQVVRADMDTALVHLPTVLRDVSVLDALDAIVKTANAPIGYTVETNRVVIHPRVPGREFVSPRVGAAVRGASVRARAEKIALPQVQYDGMPLTEIVKFLTIDARKFDPDSKGVNFLVTSLYPDVPPDERRVVPMLDGNGNPIPGTERPIVGPDLNVAIIRLGELRTNQTLVQTLDAICAASSMPITYRFEDFGILLTPKLPEAYRHPYTPGALPADQPTDRATQVLGVMPIRLLTALARELGRDAGQLSTNDTVLNGLLTEYLTPRGFATPPGKEPVFRFVNGRVHYTGLRSQAEDFARLLYKLERSVPAPPRPSPAKRPEPAKSPKPGASLPAPSPQTPDARHQTPPASQRLVTSAPTPVQLAAASPKGVTLPVPNPYYKTNSQVPFLTHSSKGAQRINRKLEEIVLPEVHFDAVPLVGVVQRLIEDAKKFDPEKQGLNFLINDVAPAAPLLDAAGNPVPVARPVALSEGLVRVTQPLKNLTLRQALDVICKTAELPTQFTVEEYAIAFIPRGPVAYYSRTFRVNPDTFIQGLQGVGSNPVLGATPGVGNAPGAAGQNQPTTTPAAPVRATVPASVPATQRTTAEANALVRQFFQSAGVTALGATNGSTRVTFNPENGLLLVRGTTNDLRLIEQAIQKVQPVGATMTNTVPQASPAARTNAPAQAPAHSSKGTQRNNAKLDEIILPEVRFDAVPLPEVVKWLDANARKFDPEKKGLNFLINIGSTKDDLHDSRQVVTPRLSLFSQPTAPGKPSATQFALEEALVRVPVSLTNLTLRQALDAICKATTVKLPDGRSTALKYSVEEYAIVFSPKLPEQADLFSRIFKVDPEKFVRGLRSVTASHIMAARTEQFRKAGGTNLTVELAELNVRMRDYLRSVGVSNLGPTNGPVGTQIYLNDQKGLLLVRASLEDLDIIQQAVELLNEKPAIKSPGAKRPQ